MSKKTALNLTCILLAGVVGGWAVRESRRGVSPVPAGEVVYGNADATFDDSGRPVDQDAEDPIDAGPVKPPEDEAWLSRFTLIERSGEEVSTEDLKGEPYVVSFFFTRCPSICPRQNAKLAELQERFAGRGVKLLAVSVDPEYDTPEVLREYANRFGADPDQWLFLTGDLTYIRRIGAEIFQQPVNKQFHTERFVLVDAEGKIEGFYSWNEPKQMTKLEAAIEGLLAGQGGALLQNGVVTE